MEELGPVSEDEVVLAFLLAELDSSRYGAFYREALARLGANQDLIRRANLADAHENRQRRELLGQARGFPDNSLFRGFPRDVTWRRVRLPPAELGRLRYGSKMEGWVRLAGGSRSVLAAAPNLDRAPGEIREPVLPIVEAVRQGRRFQPLIVLEDGDGSLVLVEGYARATAYAAAPVSEPVELLVGLSPCIRAWCWY